MAQTEYRFDHRASGEGNEMVDPHLKMICDVMPSAEGCEDCLRIGSSWVLLRLCLTCGHVGCCDSSPHRHARKHFTHTTHPVMASFEPGERWAWCYMDQLTLDVPARVAKSLR